MNNFKTLLNNELQVIIEHLQEMVSSVTFKMSIPLATYKSKTDDPELQKEYAKRDIKGVKEAAEDLISKKMKTFVPLNITLSPKFKKIEKKNVVFEITASGQDHSFLEKLKKVRL